MLQFYHYLEGVYITIITFIYIFVLLLCHGDIEPNSGPKKLKKIVYGLSAHNFSKLTHLKASITMNKHDFKNTWILQPCWSARNRWIQFSSCRPSHQYKNRRSFYYKESLPGRVISLPYFKEALLLELTHNNKKVIVSVNYRFLNQNNSEFDLFLSNFEKLLRGVSKFKPSLSLIAGDFNTVFLIVA